MIRRAPAVAVLVCLASSAGAMATSASAAEGGTRAPRAGVARVPGPVVLVGTGGVTWGDVDDTTPTFQALLEQGSVATLAVRSVRPTTCPADGWLAVTAGRRAADLEAPSGLPACRPIEVTTPDPGGSASVDHWSQYLSEASAGSFDATLGLLGQTLDRAGLVADAVGPGAAVALARPDGTAAHAWPGLGSGDATGVADLGGPDTQLLVSDVRAALATHPDLVVVDIGGIRDEAAGGQNPIPVDEQATAVDDRLAAVMDELPDGSTLLVASLSDASPSQPHLQLMSAIGPAAGGARYATSLLGSSSTRQDGIVQSTDLLPTVLDLLGVGTPEQAVGSPIRPVAAGGQPVDRLQKVLDLDLAAQSVRPIVPWFFNGLVLAQIVLYGVATLAVRNLRTGQRRRYRVLAWLRRTAVVFACVPAATFLANLVPWWRGNLPGVSVLAAVSAFVVPIAAFALLPPWRRRLLGPMGAVAGVTAAVLALDVLTGSHLVLSSLMGVQPIVAGRFYGFSNPGFALFATGCLLLAVALADAAVKAGRRRLAVGVVVAIGAVATILDGAPGLGSDFGGPPAIVPAFAVLALLVAGVRLTWRRVLLIAGVTLVVLVALSVGDWLRPSTERTHLGRFVQTAIDGGAWPVVRRKAAQNLHILYSSWLSALLPFAAAFVVLVLARPVSWGVRPLQLAYDRSPVLRHGLLAFGVLVGIGFAVNDSGTVIPAVAATVAIPLLIAVSARALELDVEDREALAIASATTPAKPR